MRALNAATAAAAAKHLLRAQCAFELKSAGAGKNAAPTRVRATRKLVRVEYVVVVILLFSSN